MKTKALARLAFLGATVCWLVMLFSDVTLLFSDLKGLTPDIPVWLPKVMLDLYVISLFYYYKFKIEREEGLNFTDLLWRVFATGLVAGGALAGVIVALLTVDEGIAKSIGEFSAEHGLHSWLGDHGYNLLGVLFFIFMAWVLYRIGTKD